MPDALLLALELVQQDAIGRYYETGGFVQQAAA